MVHGKSHSKVRALRVFQDVMRAPRVVNIEAGAQEGLEDRGGPERGQFAAHAERGREMRISSFTGSSESFLSGGMGRPSIRRLSR